MATQLPAWLQQLQAMQAANSTSGYDNSVYRDGNGYRFMPSQSNVSQGGNYGEGGYTGQNTTTGYRGGEDVPWYEGKMTDTYDLSGNFTGQVREESFENDWLDYAAMALFAAVAGGAAMSGMSGAGAVAGPGDAGWGMTLDSVTGGSGAELLGGAGAVSGGGSGVTGGGAGTGLLGSSANISAPAASNAAFNSALTSGTSAGLTGSGLVQSIASATGLSTGTVQALIAAGGGLLGGFSGGSDSGDGPSGGSKRMDPRMDSFVYGNGTPENPGLLNYANWQLNRDMAPENQAIANAYKTRAAGLLAQPIAGNGFGLLTGRG